MNNKASRRQFLKFSGAVSVGAASNLAIPKLALGSPSNSSCCTIKNNPLGFNGQRRDPVTGCYPLGNGYRLYNPRLMRFNAHDSLSPFGKGGTNGYAYCLGDPVNQKDPSGHFALLSLLIGAIVGAVVGAMVSAAAEGIQMAINPDHKFDWKQVGIGAAIGFISGGFGAAAQGTKAGAQIGLAVAETVISGGADFALNVATGTPIKQAGINAGMGALIGLGGFGIGKSVGKLSRPKLGIKSFYSGKQKLGFSDNFKGTGQDVILTHGSSNGKLLSPSGKAVYPAEFVNDLRRYLGVNNIANKDTPIHLVACNATNGGSAQELANILNRQVIAYGKGDLIQTGKMWLDHIETPDFTFDE
ncbi:RHS repeat-associated core domain-containing protein, partial [Vibrio genomosp. F10]